MSDPLDTIYNINPIKTDLWHVCPATEDRCYVEGERHGPLSRQCPDYASMCGPLRDNKNTVKCDTCHTIFRVPMKTLQTLVKFRDMKSTPQKGF